MTPGGPRHVALVGLSGCGKSTLAPILASRLGGRSVIDIDRVVESRFGRTVEEIFDRDGEPAFRDAESEALSEALDGPPSVIATGGGIVLAAVNRRMLGASSTVVWLRARPEHLAERLAQAGEARPLLRGDAEFALTRLHEERSALYAKVADVEIDVEGATPTDLADEVARALR